MKRIIPFLVLLFLIAASAYASAPEPEYGADKPRYITDDDVMRVAVEKNIIPKKTDEKYLREEMEKKHSITSWIAIDHKDKVAIIDRLKELFERDGIAIKLASEYYVNEMNGIIYNSIIRGEITPANKRGILNVFKTIAVMEGDYDNGKNKVELAKEYLGPDIFQMYKTMYPEKYKKLSGNNRGRKSRR